MKRMSEMFSLPICGYDLRGIIEQTTQQEDELVAHTINHVDTLADALEALLECAAENNLEGLMTYEDAEDALAAYRGYK